MINKLDKLARKMVKLRDGGICRICFKPATDTHHYYGRANKAVRWDEKNLISLCYKCHQKARKNQDIKDRIEEFFVNYYGPGWVLEIMEAARGIWKEYQGEETEAYLKKRIAELGEK